jgi:hypothetical protein
LILIFISIVIVVYVNLTSLSKGSVAFDSDMGGGGVLLPRSGEAAVALGGLGSLNILIDGHQLGGCLVQLVCVSSGGQAILRGVAAYQL